MDHFKEWERAGRAARIWATIGRGGGAVIALRRRRRRRRRRRCRRFCHAAPSSSSLGYVRRGAPSSSYSRRPLISIDQCCTRLLVLMNDSNVR